MGTIKRKSEKEWLKKGCDVDPQSGCWIWKRVKINKWPAVLSKKNSKNSATIYAYELYNGRVAEGLVVYPACGKKLCLNPEHLHAGLIEDLERLKQC